MTLHSQRELDLTIAKLRMLQDRHEADRVDESLDDHVRQLSMRSLKRLINQLQEEIVRFESRRSIPTDQTG